MKPGIRIVKMFAGVWLCLGLGVVSLFAQGGTGIFNTVIVSNDFRQMSSSAANYFTGKLGVGTNSPSVNLEVGGNGGVFNMIVSGRIMTGPAGNGGIFFDGTNYLQACGSYNSSKVGLYNKQWSLIINTNGAVGVGTVSPCAFMDISAPFDTGASSILRVYQPVGYPGDNDFICWGSAYGPCVGGLRCGGCFAWDTQMYGYDGLSFRAGYYDGYNPHLAIRTSGYVGIGTNTPSEKLHVAGKGRFDQGVSYTKNLGDISMGVYTNGP
jgi:hypothetical protein